MNDILPFLLFPALLLCSVKLTLVERWWMVIPSAMSIAAVPLLLHPYASRTSFAGIDRALGDRAILDLLAALVVFEALLAVLLIAAVGGAHAETTAPKRTSTKQSNPHLLSGSIAAAALFFLTGAMISKPTLQWLAIVALLLLMAWPWLPMPVYAGVHAAFRISNRAKGGALLIAPIWALISPSGGMAVYGVQMHLLNAATGVSLWRISLQYAASLFCGLCALTFVLRVLMPSWRMRLDAVMLLAFILLLAAMFLPLLYASVPPPASDIRVNWTATALIALLSAGAILWRMQKKDA